MKSFVILWRCFKHIIEFIIEFMDVNHAFMNHEFQNIGLSNFRSNFNFYLSKILTFIYYKFYLICYLNVVVS